MKKIKLILTILVMSFLVSCGDKKDENNGEKAACCAKMDSLAVCANDSTSCCGGDSTKCCKGDSTKCKVEASCCKSDSVKKCKTDASCCKKDSSSCKKEVKECKHEH